MPSTAIRVVLVRTQGPVNLGLSCRLCANLGIDDFVLVNPQCERDVKEARMFANKARDTLLNLPVYSSLEEAVADCDLVIGTTARQRDADWGNIIAAQDIGAALNEWQAKHVAIVFGNEADGLNNEELACCQHFLTLDTFSDYYSYNLTHAMAICLYQVKQALSQNNSSDNDVGLADQAKRQQLFDYWINSLDRVGYLPEHKEAWRRKHFQRLFQRMPLTEKDCDLLRGMLAQYEKRKFE